MVTFEDVLLNRISSEEIKCIITHQGVKRLKTEQGTISFASYTFKEGDVYKRHEIVVNPDYWVLNK